MRNIDLGQAIGILANVGVIAGIVFLAFELRQNNDQLERQAMAQLQERRNTVVELVINSPDLVTLLGKDPAELSVEEQDRLQMLGLRMWLNFEDQYREVMAGVLDEETVIRQLRAIYHRPRMNYALPLTWELFKQRTDPSFEQWMEQNIVRLDGE